jgi:hypothetical protein
VAVQQQSTALMRARAAASVAFGDLQVVLLRDLARRLRAGGVPPGRTMPIEATSDQLEAAVRELRSTLHGADTG